MTNRPLETDHDLMRFADGEMSEAEMTAFEARLLAEPDLAIALDDILMQNAALSQLFAVEAQRMAPKPRPVLARMRRIAKGAVPALALAASFAFGLIVSDVLQTPEPSGPPSPMQSWKVSAATYQRLYSDDTLASLPDDPDLLDQALDIAGDAVGLDLGDVPVPEGLALKRAQVLAFNGIPLVQLAYRSERGALMALCIFPRATPGAAAAPGAPGMILDQTTVEWAGTDFAYLLIGDADGPAMSEFADGFARALN